MRTNQSAWARSLWSVAIAVAAFGLAASDAAAQTPSTWSRRRSRRPSRCRTARRCPCRCGAMRSTPTTATPSNGSEVVTVPGPRIVVPAGDTSLTIKLTNLLPEATSLVIPGQPFSAAPVRTADGRVRSMTAGDAAGATARLHVHRPEARHVPVPERLAPGGAGPDGPLRRDDAGRGRRGTAARRSSGSYAHEVVLVYSEIDQGAAPGRERRHRTGTPPAVRRARSTTGRRCSSSTASRTRMMRWPPSTRARPAR